MKHGEYEIENCGVTISSSFMGILGVKYLEACLSWVGMRRGKKPVMTLWNSGIGFVTIGNLAA
jgi:hypothetical protein